MLSWQVILQGSSNIGKVESMKQIKVFFTDFALDFDINNNDFVNILRSFYDVIIDSNNPDYLFYSTFGQNYLNYHCIRIF